MVVAAAGLMKTSTLVVVEAGGTPAGPKVFELSLPGGLSMLFLELELEPHPLGV